MPKAKDHAQLQQDLHGFFKDRCPGIEVEVAHAARWNRTCFTFRWEGFAGLLLEERFRLLARLVPPDYFQAHCSTAVWLELTPNESVDEFLAQPRSEDVEARLPAIFQALGKIQFFAALEDELVRIPPNRCTDDFSVTRRVLGAKGVSADLTRDALLAFMHHQAYNDWEVLRGVRPIAESKEPKP